MLFTRKRSTPNTPRTPKPVAEGKRGPGRRRNNSSAVSQNVIEGESNHGPPSKIAVVVQNPAVEGLRRSERLRNKVVVMPLDNSSDSSDEGVEDEEIEGNRNMDDDQSQQPREEDIAVFAVEDAKQLEHEDDLKSEPSTNLIEDTDMKNLRGDGSMAGG